MINLDYYTTRVDGIGSVPIADFLLTPVRWMVNGKHYHVVRKVSESEFPYSHTLKPATISKTEKIAKIILGTLGTILLFPLVLVGFGIKICTRNQYSLENYFYAKSVAENLDTAEPSILHNTLNQAPLVISVPKKVSKKISLEELLSIWDKVGKNNSNYEEVKNHLNEWITESVPNPEKYNYISEKIAPEAAADLQRYLRLIIKELQSSKHNNDTAERVILSLFDASKVCSPTWLEVAIKEYRTLKGGGGQRQRILRYVQEIKEEIILDWARKNIPDGHWHILNYARWLMGKELGLDTSHISYDAAAQQKEDGIFTKEMCRGLFFEHYTTEYLIEALIEKINYDNNGNYDQELGKILGSILETEAKNEGIDTEDEDWDVAMKTLEKYFDQKDGKYYLNTSGTQAILKHYKLIG